MQQLAEPGNEAVTPVRALEPIHLMRPEWDEDAGGHWICLYRKRAAFCD